MPRKKEKEKMLLFTEENKKGVISACDSIISGKGLSVKQLEDTYLFMVEAGSEIERKIKMVLEIVYPSVWKCFYGLDNFNIFCKTLYFRYINNDNELVSFKFPLRLLGLSRKELEVEAENTQKD
jgi:hypothetical protein